MNLKNLSNILSQEPQYRYQQAYQALWRDFISSWQELSTFPQSLRTKLEAACPLTIKAELVEKPVFAKQQQALISLEDGEKVMTSLAITGKEEVVVYLASQVAAPNFYGLSLKPGLKTKRNLQAEEIIEQLVFWERYLKENKPTNKINRIILAGMGEPLLNVKEVVRALKFMNNPETLGKGWRRLGIVTTAPATGLKKLASAKLPISLNISLLASNDELRRDLEATASSPIYDLFKAIDFYLQQGGRQVNLSYVLLKNINDQDLAIQQLIKLLSNRSAYQLKLIAPQSFGPFTFTSPERVLKLKDQLAAAKIILPNK
ncbi:MAG: hypothetical protein ACOX0C_02810 [Patescibacteria group bacterium]|jgi:23S rRNA (adenine2503-C2)-methyltransferase